MPRPKPEITQMNLFAMQICVPKSWTFKKIMAFAEIYNPAGTSGGWQIRKDKKRLAGHPVRNPCDKRNNFVHVTLDV